MVRPFWGSVTLKVFQNGLHISWIPMCKLSTTLWITPCPMLCTTQFIRPDLNYLCVTTIWCRVAHLFPSKDILCDVEIFFLFFICELCVDSYIFCFTTKVQLYCEKIFKTQQINYTLTNSWCTEAVAPGLSTRLGLASLCKSAMWHNWVTPDRMAQLGLASLCYASMWCN
jgi:hypothetical protein